MIKGQNIPQSNIPEVQKLDAKAYSVELQQHEAAYNHNNIHAPGSDAETVTSVGVLILGAAEKIAPVDADMIPIMDTADSNKVRKLSWVNIKATLKTYFDTLYAAASTVSFPGFGSTGSTACVGNDSRLSDSRTPVAHTHTATNVIDFASVALTSAPAETATTIGALINSATAITAPDDTDTLAMWNHTGGLLHKITWAYVKSVLKTYFDTVYAKLAGSSSQPFSAAAMTASSLTATGSPSGSLGASKFLTQMETPIIARTYFTGPDGSTAGRWEIYFSSSTTPVLHSTFAEDGTFRPVILRLTSSPPASASAAGIAGTITYDSNYIYICTATNTWKRVAISAW